MEYSFNPHIPWPCSPNEGAKSRDRVLNYDELRILWRAVANDDSDFGRIIRLLMFTGCRRHEVDEMSWHELDDNGVLHIPGTRTKNHELLSLRLPPTALNIIRGVERRPGNPHCFGTSARGFTAWSYAMATLNVRIAANEGRPLAPWTLHDLRRTMRNALEREPLNIPWSTAERCIGHLVGSKVSRTYNPDQYINEIGDALKRWHDHLLSIVGDNVVALRA